MKRCRRALAALVTGPLFLALGTVAHASTYDFSFLGTSGAISYDITAQFSTGAANGPGFDITSITGSISGPNLASTTITGLEPGYATPPNTLTAPSGYTYDNIFIPTAPYFTETGALFVSNTGAVYNFYDGGSYPGTTPGLLYMSTDDEGLCASPNCDPGVTGAFVVRQVIDAPPTPLPSAWSAMLIGLATFGFVAYRRQKKYCRKLFDLTLPCPRSLTLS